MQIKLRRAFAAPVQPLSSSPYSSPGCIQRLTVSSDSLHPVAHCIQWLTVSSSSLHPVAHYIQRLTVSSISLYLASHCIQHLTVSSNSLYPAAHYIQQLTMCRVLMKRLKLTQNQGTPKRGEGWSCPQDGRQRD